MSVCHGAGMVYGSWIASDARRPDASGALAATAVAAPCLNMAYLAARSADFCLAVAAPGLSFGILAILWRSSSVVGFFWPPQSVFWNRGSSSAGSSSSLVRANATGGLTPL